MSTDPGDCPGVLCGRCGRPGCGFCRWLADPTPMGRRYRRLWGCPRPEDAAEIPDDAPARPWRRDGCVHLGVVLDRRGRACDRCWVRACGLHGRCTTGATVDGVACCADCPDFEEA